MSQLILPSWMQPQTEERGPIEPDPKARPNIRFARRALSGFSGLLAEMVTQKDSASRNGLLQPLDARVKTVALVSLVVVMTWVHSWLALCLGYAACLAMAVASQLPAKRIIKVWLVVPLFTLAIMLPATLNIVTPGKPLFSVWHSSPFSFLPDQVSVTSDGLAAAGKMMLRTGACVSFALLLAYTTRTDRLFRGLRALFVPSLFVTVLVVMDRYLAVVAKVAEEIHMAKLSRSIQSRGLRQEHEWVAAGMGSLFRRTQSLGQQVYLAMLSRGFRGEALIIDDMRLTSRDALFAAGAAVFGIVLIGLR